jgi:1-phosphofructokinase family hexose kinase
MIVCVNGNLALDRVLIVKGYAPKASLKPIRAFDWPGGSGTHAALVARQLGSKPVLVGGLGGTTGLRLRLLIADAGLDHQLIDWQPATRQTTSVVDLDSGNVCDIAEYASEISPAEASLLFQSAAHLIDNSALLLVSGSLPPGVPPTFYHDLAIRAHDKSVPAIGDLTGEVLRHFIRARPLLVKVSRTELSESIGQAITTVDNAVQAARCLVDQGAQHVLASLDAQGGVLVSREAVHRYNQPDNVHAWNTIGSGDTLFGALAHFLESGIPLPEAVRRGFAAALVNLSRPEPGWCGPDELAKHLHLIQMETHSIS